MIIDLTLSDDDELAAGAPRGLDDTSGDRAASAASAACPPPRKASSAAAEPEQQPAVRHDAAPSNAASATPAARAPPAANDGAGEPRLAVRDAVPPGVAADAATRPPARTDDRAGERQPAARGAVSLGATALPLSVRIQPAAGDGAGERWPAAREAAAPSAGAWPARAAAATMASQPPARRKRTVPRVRSDGDDDSEDDGAICSDVHAGLAGGASRARCGAAGACGCASASVARGLHSEGGRLRVRDAATGSFEDAGRAQGAALPHARAAPFAHHACDECSLDEESDGQSDEEDSADSDDETGDIGGQLDDKAGGVGGQHRSFSRRSKSAPLSEFRELAEQCIGVLRKGWRDSESFDRRWDAQTAQRFAEQHADPVHTKDNVNSASMRGAVWQCPYGHYYVAVVQTRCCDGTGCQVCYWAKNQHAALDATLRDEIVAFLPTNQEDRAKAKAHLKDCADWTDADRADGTVCGHCWHGAIKTRTLSCKAVGNGCAACRRHRRSGSAALARIPERMRRECRGVLSRDLDQDTRGWSSAEWAAFVEANAKPGVDFATLLRSSKQYAVFVCEKCSRWEISQVSTRGQRRSSGCHSCRQRSSAPPAVLSEELRAELVANLRTKEKPPDYLERCPPRELDAYAARARGETLPDGTPFGYHFCLWQCGRTMRDGTACSHRWTARYRDRAEDGTRCPRCSLFAETEEDGITVKLQRECVAVLDAQELTAELQGIDARLRSGEATAADMQVLGDAEHVYLKGDVVKRGSAFYARWRCTERGHEWLATVNSRARRGCQRCKEQRGVGYHRNTLNASWQAQLEAVLGITIAELPDGSAAAFLALPRDEQERFHAEGVDKASVLASSKTLGVWTCTHCTREFIRAINYRLQSTCPHCKDLSESAVASGRGLPSALQPFCLCVLKTSKGQAARIASTVRKDDIDDLYGDQKHLTLRPDNVLAGSNFHAIWQCAGCPQLWILSVAKYYKRISNGDARLCPACRTRSEGAGMLDLRYADELICVLKDKSPDLRSPDELDEYKALYEAPGVAAGGLSARSNRHALWRCSECDVIYKKVVSKRTAGQGCPQQCGTGRRKGLNPKAGAAAAAETELAFHACADKDFVAILHAHAPALPTTADEQAAYLAEKAHRHPLKRASAQLLSSSTMRVVWRCGSQRATGELCGHCWVASCKDRVRTKFACPECTAAAAEGLPAELQQQLRALLWPDASRGLLALDQLEVYLQDERNVRVRVIASTRVGARSSELGVWVCGADKHVSIKTVTERVNQHERSQGRLTACNECRLGEHGWTLSKVRALIASLVDDEGTLASMSPAELHTVFTLNGALTSASKGIPLLKVLHKVSPLELRRFARNEPSLAEEFLERVAGGEDEEAAANAILGSDDASLCRLEGEASDADPAGARAAAAALVADGGAGAGAGARGGVAAALGALGRSLGALKLHSRASCTLGACDVESVEFLLARSEWRLWALAYAPDGDVHVADARRQLEGCAEGTFAREVLERFLERHGRATAMQLPAGYAGPVPKLMQRLVVVRAEEEGCAGLINFSDTGTGKTISALLVMAHRIERSPAAQVAVIFCPNSVRKQWESEIGRAFPGIFDVRLPERLPSERVKVDKKPVVLVYNYEKLSACDGERIPEEMRAIAACLARRCAFVCLDELHSIKVRKAQGSADFREVAVDAGDESGGDGELGEQDGPLQPTVPPAKGRARKAAAPPAGDGDGAKEAFRRVALSKRRQAIESLTAALRHSLCEGEPGSAVPEPGSAALLVLGLTATPVVNELEEARSLLRAVTGLAFDDLRCPRTSPSMDECLAVHRQLFRHGVRFLFEAAHTLMLRDPLSGGHDELWCDAHAAYAAERGGGQARGRLASAERRTRAKLTFMVDYCRQAAHPPAPAAREPVLLYTHFIGDHNHPILETLKGALVRAGLRVATYTGRESAVQREAVKADFVAGRLDVLIGSQAVCTGVDGLQSACRRLLVNLLPMTYAEWRQLQGRVFREGVQGDVDVVVPMAFFWMKDPVSGAKQRGSEDGLDLERILQKRTIADAAVDGEWQADKGAIARYAKGARDALQRMLDRIDRGEVRVNEREGIAAPEPAPAEQASASAGLPGGAAAAQGPLAPEPPRPPEPAPREARAPGRPRDGPTAAAGRASAKRKRDDTIEQDKKARDYFDIADYVPRRSLLLFVKAHLRAALGAHDAAAVAAAASERELVQLLENVEYADPLLVELREHLVCMRNVGVQRQFFHYLYRTQVYHLERRESDEPSQPTAAESARLNALELWHGHWRDPLLQAVVEGRARFDPATLRAEDFASIDLIRRQRARRCVRDADCTGTLPAQRARRSSRRASAAQLRPRRAPTWLSRVAIVGSSSPARGPWRPRSAWAASRAAQRC
ncbi:hypothetical protein T492DRAFT_894739 [Pavlovales sp. CCMP2436]|nr:hypothetical protein T492DRAFT_894739 [Pavlovales sp. CCMP2436]